MPDRPSLDLVIKNVRVVRPRQPTIDRLDLGVKDGRWARVAPEIPAAEAREVYATPLGTYLRRPSSAPTDRDRG